MSLNLSEIGFQNNSLEQKSTLASVEATYSSELSLKTREGDLVSLSFGGEQSLSESSSQTVTQEKGSLEEFSSVARAAASYSLTIQGDLNEEELAAINKLAEEIAPLAREFFTNGNFNLEDSTDVLAENLGELEQIELSLERTVVATFETRSVSRLPEEDSNVGNIENVPSQAPELETEGIRDFPALVQSTLDAVFESEAKKVPEQDPILRSLNDLLAFIRNRLGEYFDPLTGLSGATEDPAPASDGAVDLAPAPPEQ